MPIDPADFVDVAVRLRLRQPARANEATDRSASGRAYYAAYLSVREYVRSEYRAPRMNVRHDMLYRALQACEDEGLRQVGELLAQLHAVRTRADYYMDGKFGEFQVAMGVAQAERVLALLPSLAGKLPPGVVPHR